MQILYNCEVRIAFSPVTECVSASDTLAASFEQSVPGIEIKGESSVHCLSQVFVK